MIIAAVSTLTACSGEKTMICVEDNDSGLARTMSVRWTTGRGAQVWFGEREASARQGAHVVATSKTMHLSQIERKHKNQRTMIVAHHHHLDQDNERNWQLAVWTSEIGVLGSDAHIQARANGPTIKREPWQSAHRWACR